MNSQVVANINMSSHVSENILEFPTILVAHLRAREAEEPESKIREAKMV
jgi:hypothetical protein